MSFTIQCVPSQLSDLLFADQTSATQVNNFATHKMKESLLLCGPPGTGKSKIATVLLQHRITNALGVSPAQFVVHADHFKTADEIDSLFHLQLCDFDFALVVIDELDELTSSKMLQLRALIDKRVKIAGIIATTNYIGKIDPAMRSRFRCIKIDCPPPQSFLPKAQQYLQQRNIVLPDKQVLSVIQAAGPDIRAVGRAIDDLLFAQQTHQPAVHALPQQPVQPASVSMPNAGTCSSK